MAEQPRSDSELDGLLGDSSADELWLMSYADLLTLLLGFFVLIIAGSVAKPTKFEQMAASIAGSETPLKELKTQVDDLVQRAQLYGVVTAREDTDGLNIEFKDALLFDSGSARVRTDGYGVLSQVASLLNAYPKRSLTIEGHTDDVPIRTPTFPSNWELSTQRAINVLNILVASGVSRDRLSVRGYADTKPTQTDGPLEQRRLANRRVVIRVE